MEVDPAALGMPVAAFVRLRPAPGQLSRLAELAASIDQVSECHRITGEDCFLVKVHAETVAALEDVLDRFLVHGQTISSIVVTSPVPAAAAADPGLRGVLRRGGGRSAPRAGARPSPCARAAGTGAGRP